MPSKLASLSAQPSRMYRGVLNFTPQVPALTNPIAAKLAAEASREHETAPFRPPETRSLALAVLLVPQSRSWISCISPKPLSARRKMQARFWCVVHNARSAEGLFRPDYETKRRAPQHDLPRCKRQENTSSFPGGCIGSELPLSAFSQPPDHVFRRHPKYLCRILTSAGPISQAASYVQRLPPVLTWIFFLAGQKHSKSAIPAFSAPLPISCAPLIG